MHLTSKQMWAVKKSNSTKELWADSVWKDVQVWNVRPQEYVLPSSFYWLPTYCKDSFISPPFQVAWCLDPGTGPTDQGQKYFPKLWAKTLFLDHWIIWSILLQQREPGTIPPAGSEAPTRHAFWQLMSKCLSSYLEQTPLHEVSLFDLMGKALFVLLRLHLRLAALNQGWDLWHPMEQRELKNGWAESSQRSRQLSWVLRLQTGWTLL